MSNNWQLRVLEGEQTGANIDLQPTRYLIGADEACDIVLTGEGVGDKHLEAFFADGRFSILRASAPVFIDGETIEQFPSDVDAQHIITIGGVSIAFDAQDSEWFDAVNIAGIRDKINSAKSVSPTNKNSQNGQAKLSPSIGKRVVASFALLGILMIAGIIVWDSPLPSSHPAPIMPTVAEGREPLLSRLSIELHKNPAFANVRADIRSGAATRLIGYVDTVAALDTLRALALHERVPLRVDSLEQTRTILSRLLGERANATHYHLSGGKDGMHLSLFGIVDTPASVQAFEDELRREIPAITHIESNIESRSDVQKRITIFHNATLEYSTVKNDVQNGALVLRGTILGDYAQEWRKGLEKILETLPLHLVVRDEVTVAPSLKASVDSVLIGTNAAVRLSFPDENSGLYRIGARLPNGLEITNIERHVITLSDGIDDFVLPLTVRGRRPWL